MDRHCKQKYRNRLLQLDVLYNPHSDHIKISGEDTQKEMRKESKHVIHTHTQKPNKKNKDNRRNKVTKKLQDSQKQITKWTQ